MEHKASYLIKDTTKEQRISLIKEWLPEGDGFEDEAIDLMWDMYDPYIRGEKEIAECNAAFRSGIYEESDARAEVNCAMGKPRR